ncbi:hypothetical protein N8131_01890 [Flavobacteriaceae bacterium]|nr:hypothetical protein [Flavobacteriaceae bacterium]
MKLSLLSCFSHRPDRRAIAKCITEISSTINETLSKELTDILLDGDSVEIEIEDKSSGSALRALRKLNVDYEFIE